VTSANLTPDASGSLYFYIVDKFDPLFPDAGIPATEPFNEVDFEDMVLLPSLSPSAIRGQFKPLMKDVGGETLKPAIRPGHQYISFFTHFDNKPGAVGWTPSDQPEIGQESAI
jgi:hypothetical protein